MDTAADRALPTLYAIASLIGKTDDPRDALGLILERLIARFGARSGSIALLNPDTGRLEIEVHRGLPRESADFALRLGQGVTGWVAFHGRPLLVPDVAADPRYVTVLAEVRCEMAAPMLDTTKTDESSQVLGVVNLDHTIVGGFTPADLEELVRLTAEATAVLQRLWQLERLRGQARQLETLTTLAQSLVAKLRPQELLDTIARESRSLLGSALAMIFLHDAVAGTLQVASADAQAGTTLPAATARPVGDCLAATVLRTHKLAEFADVRSFEYADLDDVPREAGVVSALLAPMMAEGLVTGVIAVFSSEPHRYNNDERRLLQALANLGAVALENARLYGRVFQSEDTLRKTETLNTLGLLAAEIAHEIRNPLTVIKLLFGSLGLEFAPDDPRAKDTRIIGEKLNQLEAIVGRVLNFAKAPASLHAHWSLDDIVADTLHLIRLKLHQSKIELDYLPSPEPIVVDANKGQIQQVLLNLLLNSTQAMPEGGRIRLVCYRGEHGGLRQAVVDLTDTGTGIPGGMETKLFDSFLSGRPDGTGLGLAIAKRIMVSHRGDVTLVDTSPRGTTFRLTLPLVV